MLNIRRIAKSVNAAGFLDPGAGQAGARVPAPGQGPGRRPEHGVAYGPRRDIHSRAAWNPGLWSRYVALGDSFTAGLGDPEPLSPGSVLTSATPALSGPLPALDRRATQTATNDIGRNAGRSNRGWRGSVGTGHVPNDRFRGGLERHAIRVRRGT